MINKVKKRILILLFILMPLFSLSQGSVNYISLLPEHFKIENRNFYISKVIDERKNKFSLGISQVGPFNKKAVTKFKNGLENSFFNFISNSLDSEIVHQAVTIKVLDLDISERTTATTETGTVSLRINFYARGTKGEQVKIFELTKVKKERAFDVTKGHERRIREVLVEIIEEFSISAWEENLSNPIVDESTENLIIPINIVTGKY